MQSQTRQVAGSVGFCAAEWPARTGYGERFARSKARRSAVKHERTVNAGLWPSSSRFPKQGRRFGQERNAVSMRAFAKAGLAIAILLAADLSAAFARDQHHGPRRRIGRISRPLIPIIPPMLQFG